MKIKRAGNKGFTLVELAMVILIFGMIMSTMLLAFKLYYQTSHKDQTRTTIEEVKGAFVDYLSVRGRYPCPARLEAQPGDADYGFQNCALARIIIAVGRDANEDGNDDRILVGGVPFATILHPNPAIGVPTRDFSEADAFDAWGKKLTYAVSELMTDAGYNENYGAIDIVDEHGQTILEVAQTAHTVIISHGPNGVGAFTADGQLTENCSLGITEDTDGDGEPDAQPGVPAAYTTNPDETENCDMNDARFMSGLYSERTSSFYDDMMTYQLIKSSSIWVPSGLVFDDNGTPGNPADDIEILQVSNTNPGNIGLGTQSPTEMLEVVGDIQAMQILADQYCDSAGQDCMSAEAIAGTGMTCPNGQVATGIENNSVRCAPAFSGPVVGTCPANQYMVGISNVTGVICESL